mmetsp:Transcript_5614/g.10718  ORF Transcript_5614/g.10718 Transcript_5614/m.10718 type:complete len:256 (-) Transcript_5614:671-1438(-)
MAYFQKHSCCQFDSRNECRCLFHSSASMSIKLCCTSWDWCGLLPEIGLRYRMYVFRKDRQMCALQGVRFIAAATFFQALFSVSMLWPPCSRTSLYNSCNCTVCPHTLTTPPLLYLMEGSLLRHTLTCSAVAREPRKGLLSSITRWQSSGLGGGRALRTLPPANSRPCALALARPLRGGWMVVQCLRTHTSRAVSESRLRPSSSACSATSSCLWSTPRRPAFISMSMCSSPVAPSLSCSVNASGALKGTLGGYQAW